LICARTLSVVIGYAASPLVLAVVLVTAAYVSAEAIAGFEGFRSIVLVLQPFVIYNSFAILTCLSLVFVALLSVLYRAIWFLTPRAIYVPIKFQLLRKRKVLGCLGGSLDADTVAFV